MANRSFFPKNIRLFFLLVVVALALSLSGCFCNRDPRVEVGHDTCHFCEAVIDVPEQACGYLRGGCFVPFDSPACLVGSYEAERTEDKPPIDRIYFADYTNGFFYPAPKTTFLLTDHCETVGGGHVICFGRPEAAQKVRQHDDEVITDWLGYYNQITGGGSQEVPKVN